MKKTIQTVSVSVAATTTEPNILKDSRVENVPADDAYQVEVLATASQAGAKLTFDADNDTAIEESELSAQNRVPITPDDFIDSFIVAGGSKLFAEVNNTAGSATTIFMTIRLTPLSQL